MLTSAPGVCDGVLMGGLKAFFKGFARGASLDIYGRAPKPRLPKWGCELCHGFGFIWVGSGQGLGTAPCPCLSRKRVGYGG